MAGFILLIVKSERPLDVDRLRNRLFHVMDVPVLAADHVRIVERERAQPSGNGQRLCEGLRILRIVGNGQDAFQRAVEKRRLRRAEGKDRQRDARRGQRRIVQPHLVATRQRTAKIVERPIARRLCGEDRVGYAHASLPKSASVWIALKLLSHKLPEVCDLNHCTSAASKLIPNIPDRPPSVMLIALT
jgi:hypothetical protein